MLRRLITLCAVFALFALLAASVASADPCCHANGSNCNPSGGTTTSGNGQGAGGGVGNNCQEAPEAPREILFPLAAAVVVGGFVFLTRKRRPADQ